MSILHVTISSHGKSSVLFNISIVFAQSARDFRPSVASCPHHLRRISDRSRFNREQPHPHPPSMSFPGHLQYPLIAEARLLTVFPMVSLFFIDLICKKPTRLQLALLIEKRGIVHITTSSPKLPFPSSVDHAEDICPITSLCLTDKSQFN